MKRNYYNGGAIGKEKVPASKVKVFRKMFDEINKKAGKDYERVMDLIGLSNSSMDLMNKGSLTRDNGFKILRAYEKYIKNNQVISLSNKYKRYKSQ